MTEVIHPCSKEQPERRFFRIGVYLLWKPPKLSRHSRVAYAGTRFNVSAKHMRTGTGGGVGGIKNAVRSVDGTGKGSVTEHPPGEHCHLPPDAGEGDLAVTRRGCSPRT
ncbi:hypothetical protein FTO68_03190 [Methanocalculus taiwanensis]|uniref:Uncharacterized protein n=1 Tax=Methanocalculus taiwanensis TaxID=106207 RepID=A0ABD4TL43_9EURY|nr:hypothetical protein [Methanocalculus taiwanensis]MCQ1537995.1 hypothetical protein [Methanocalculus taiwanensis]